MHKLTTSVLYEPTAQSGYTASQCTRHQHGAAHGLSVPACDTDHLAGTSLIRATADGALAPVQHTLSIAHGEPTPRQRHTDAAPGPRTLPRSHRRQNRLLTPQTAPESTSAPRAPTPDQHRTPVQVSTEPRISSRISSGARVGSARGYGATPLHPRRYTTNPMDQGVFYSVANTAYSLQNNQYRYAGPDLTRKALSARFPWRELIPSTSGTAVTCHQLTSRIGACITAETCQKLNAVPRNQVPSLLTCAKKALGTEHLRAVAA